jgi:hypothetical protein
MCRFKIMRGDNYLETFPLLDMASSMCQALQSGEKESTRGSLKLQDELETLLRHFPSYHG